MGERADGDVRVVDYGIRGMHLAYDLLDGYDVLVLVDAMPVGETAGDLTVLEVGPDDLGKDDFDPHGMNPAAVLASLGSLGGTLPRTFVVGCRPASTDEGIGLSDAVATAVPLAVGTVTRLLDDVLVREGA
jgi:hydrogenase maturation protease